MQGVVRFKNQISFTTLKEFHNKIRWSKCKNLRASIKYCSKQNSRNGEIYTHGFVEKWLWKDRNMTAAIEADILEDMKKMMIEDIDCDEFPKGLFPGDPDNGGVPWRGFV